MEHRGQRQDEQVYTIKQVTAMTGVPENTIRSWERRFGVPTPGRTGGNQRTYSTKDIQVIQSLQASRERGRTMEQAILDLRASDTPDSESHDPFPVTQPATERSLAGQEIIDRMMQAIEHIDDVALNTILADALWTSSVEDVCFEVLLTLDDVLPEREIVGSVSRVQDTFGRDWVARKLHAAFDASRPEDGRRSVIVAAMQDSEARLLSLCYAIALSRAGYRVHWAAGSLAARDVSELITRLEPAAILLVARSRLSKVALRAGLEDLIQVRNSGGWSGIVMVSGLEGQEFAFGISVEPNAKHVIDLLEEKFRANAANLRLLKRE